MTDSSHIFIPEDATLEARIHAYKTMRNELNNIEASQKLAKSDEWKDRVGTEEELQQAHNIIKNSLRATLNNITDIDLQQAQEQSLMSTEDINNFSVMKNRFENSVDLKQVRINNNKSDIKKSRAPSVKKEHIKDNDLER